ncbi:hypothetical protein D3C76_1455790 [compost metagenome]
MRASRGVLDEMYQDDALKALPFWCALEPQDSAGGWVELVLLMPGETHLPLSSFYDPPRVIVAPEKLADPSSPYRTWWECRPGSKLLESFVQESQ